MLFAFCALRYFVMANFFVEDTTYFLHLSHVKG
jgi:hypothetical protein